MKPFDIFTQYGILAQSGFQDFYEITIPSIYIDSTLTNFPMTVRLDESNFDFSLAEEDGSNLYFTDSSNQVLDFELEQFQANSEAVPTYTEEMDLAPESIQATSSSYWSVSNGILNINTQNASAYCHFGLIPDNSIIIGNTYVYTGRIRVNSSGSASYAGYRSHFWRINDGAKTISVMFETNQVSINQGSSAYTVLGSIDMTVWRDIKIVYNNTIGADVYVDDIYIGNWAYSSWSSTTSNYSIIGDDSTVNAWGANIDYEYVRLYINPTNYDLTESKSATYHVRIPSVSSTTDTVFKLKFNGSGYASGNNPTSVWDSNYVMVQHMGDSLVDSTGNGNDGTNNGSVVSSGFNGNGRYFADSGDNILINGTDIVTNWTATSIAKIVTTTELADTCLNRNGTNNTGLKYNQYNETGYMGITKYGVSDYTSTTPTQIGVYAHYTWRNNGSIDFLLNGGQKSTLALNLPCPMETIYPTDSTPDASGNIIDEIRVSNVVRSDAWVKAEYQFLMENPLTFQRKT